MDMQFVHFKCLCVQPANQPTDMTSKRSVRKHLKSPSQSIQLDIVYFFIACNCLGQNLYFVPFLQCVNVLTLKIFLISHNCNGKSCFGCYKCFRNWFGYVLRIAPCPPRHTHTLYKCPYFFRFSLKFNVSYWIIV